MKMFGERERVRDMEASMGAEQHSHMQTSYFDGHKDKK